MKHTLVASAALLLASATVLAAPTVYTYTGAPFTSSGGDAANVPGAYTTSMRIRGSITLSEAMAPGGSLSFLVGTGDPRVVRFSFNDGRTEFTHENGLHAGSQFDLTANASGDISAWYVALTRRDVNREVGVAG